MKKFANETIIIHKNGWKFMWNTEREKHGFAALSNEQLERIWSKIVSKNRGANPATHPISNDEIRIDKDTFNMKWEDVKETLSNNGHAVRDDGFVAEGYNM